MSVWKKLLGISNKEKELMLEPEHDLAKAQPDDLMVRDEDKVTDQKDQSKNIQETENNLDDKKDNLNNKDSP